MLIAPFVAGLNSYVEKQMNKIQWFRHNTQIIWLYFLVVNFFLLTIPVIGQTEDPFETARPLYVGARALSMGNAFTAVADDATAGFWNPAGLIQWQGVKFFGFTKLHNRQDYRFDPKGIGYSWRGNSFYWGNKITLGVASGVPDFNYYSFGRQLGAYFATGLSLKFKRKHPSDYYQFFGYHTSYDIGVLIKPRPYLKFGCLLQNLEGRGFQWVTFGTAYRYATIQTSADIAISTQNVDADIYLGIEWTPTSFFSMRLGSSDGSFTCGVGLQIIGLSISYGRIYEKRTTSDFISAELAF